MATATQPTMRPQIVEFSRSFRAMNTEILAILATLRDRKAEAEAALDRVQWLFADNEAALSRFLPDSELSRLNRSAGQPFRASPLLFEVVAEAIAAARATGGIFDPTVLACLVAVGYDRSFELLRDEPERAATPPAPTSPAGSWEAVELEKSTRSILLPAGAGLDLGGIGKGWTVDRAVEILRPFRNFALDAGGDLYAGGTQADGSLWTVGLEDPFEPGSDLGVLAVADRAVATSTVRRRRWTRGGRELHHLIDPRSGRPAVSGIVSATVVAETVARAEVLAKTALLLGPRAGLQFLDLQPGVEWALVLDDERLEASSGLMEMVTDES